MSIARKIALTCRLLELGARWIDKIKDSLKTTFWLAKGQASHHNTRAAMSLPLMLESELNFDALRKAPFRHEADALGRPLDLLVGQIERIGKIDSNPLGLADPGFILEGHNQTS